MTRLKVLGLTAAVASGWLGGICWERSSLPFAQLTVVSAAGPIPSSSKLPVAVPAEPSPTSSRPLQIMRFGFPSHDTIRSFDNFVLSYDRRNRTANWVFEHMNRDTLKPNDSLDRTKCDFHVDPSVHVYFRGENRDYLHSGYDRGHLAAASNHRLSQEQLHQTFTLSNISPQVGEGFNRGVWNNLERHVRGLTKFYKNVYVCTGPLYLPRKEGDGKLYVKYEVIGANNVAVPTHFFKVVVAETNTCEYDMECYVLPNKKVEEQVPLKAFLVPLESIERAAGMLFFDKIPQQALRKINGHKT